MIKLAKNKSISNMINLSGGILGSDEAKTFTFKIPINRDSNKFQLH